MMSEKHIRELLKSRQITRKIMLKRKRGGATRFEGYEVFQQNEIERKLLEFIVKDGEENEYLKCCR